MIRNETALRNSGRKLADLVTHRDKLQAASVVLDEHGSDEAILKRMGIEAVDDLIHQVQDEINEFEAAWDSHPAVIEVGTVAELPAAVIKARIAAGLTLSELAQRTGLHETAIQRYERNGYESVSCRRLQMLLDATGIRVALVDQHS